MPRGRKIDADLAYELKRIDARLAEGEITRQQAEECRRLVRESAAFRARF